LSPSSVLVATLAGSIDTMIDEEGNAEDAQLAVFDALERLAAAVGMSTVSWGPAPDYRRQDMSVIAGNSKWH
jgi:hypothetical protein